ncbi:AGAP003053-PA [Anopheles gambiae str. PEST]|uniref:AGAP003053-PA n=2 Tax=gambiae species complex TaxID=44542 RepID=Q7PGS3_ANOGA|nr:AGAP003053-PA [Anopheles gambiae str. PEST]QXO36244.1 olfactory receptor Or45 [Anopheles coluzzii]QXO36274.1 olfactory receptor Or45 [Anopheles gambiae]QXO36248.1 olfactory receptor Or45 [Anopheles coluzzii]QXO36250.1 olfactory receptor Or45 [Anopheles coluzzii]
MPRATSNSAANLERLVIRISSHMAVLKLNIIDPAWRPTLRFGIVLFLTALVPVYIWQGIKVYRTRFETLLEVLSVAGCGWQMFFRMYFYLFQQDRCRQIVQEVRDQRTVYGADRNPRMEKLFRAGTKRMLLAYRVIHLMYGTSYFFQLGPLIMPDPHKCNLPLALQLPFLPPDRNMVYYCINYAHHLLLNTIGVFILLPMDGVLIVALLNICTRIAALQLLLEELDAKLGTVQWQQTAHLDAELNRIIELHIDTKRFARVIYETYQMHFFSMFSVLCFVICMCMNVVARDPRSTLIPFGLASTGQLFVICMLGNVLYIVSDRLKDSVYGIRWYRCTVSQQKRLMFLLANAQPEIVMGAVFIPVTMTSFVTIIRAAYSYFTILY